ncbi:hypothetical protein EUTSA_v10023117mg [Eutrema salsugineum]|uniref:Ubiquitin-like protease family profile domain-containing protein n=1 Tax=Eutrema salsugineum TaxID=72664 RepID=V4M3U7_EUTSA|nr:hypothetical protein EUTSA_v10023117mg [Eutrema salsugineum]
MDAIMYLFREYTAFHRWKPDCVVFMNRFFAVQIEGVYKKLIVETFSVLIPWIVKEVQTPKNRKHLNMKQGINKTVCHCGVYALKYIECHKLGLAMSLMEDDNINAVRKKITCDLIEAANGPIIIERMSRYEPTRWKTKIVDLD